MEFCKNCWNYIKEHSEIFTVLGLGIIFYLIFFYGIGNYYLMDVDETRYVAMARDMFHSKDFLTLYLNGEYFFEKPPLYFWQECLSFMLWGKVNEFSARFPVALLGFIFSFVVYFTSKKIVNRTFGIFTSLILATSLEFIMLSKYAILDIVLTFYVGLALVVYFQTFFCQEKNKKYYWWFFYLFSGLAVMAKGIPGFVIPFGTVFFASIITKRFKENFKPLFMLPGIIVFLLVVLPWHIVMFLKHNPLFFDEYIIKHHLHRFINTANNEIGRKQPFYYYFLTILWGFIPWIFSAVAVLIEKICKIIKTNSFETFGIFVKDENSEKLIFDFEKLDNIHKLLVLNLVSFIFILLFFSSSSTKLVTYILPVYFPLAMITGYVWENYVIRKIHEKAINITVKILGWIFAVAGVVAILTPLYLPKQLNSDIAEIKWITLISLLIFGIGSLLFVKYKKYAGVFGVYVLFMAVISAFGTGGFFKVDYKFGQQDLVEFAKYAQKHNYTISSFEMERKYSLIYYNDKPADYNPDQDLDIEPLKEDLNRKNNIVIVKNRDLEKVEGKLNYKVLKTGRRYSMLKSEDK